MRILAGLEKGDDMATIRQMLDCITPRSAFSITLVTFMVLFLIVVFFVHDIQLVSLNAELDDGSGLLADRALMPRSVSTERPEDDIVFNTDFTLQENEFEMYPIASEDNFVAPANPDNIGNFIAKLDPSLSVPVEPSGRYSSSNSTLPAGVSPGYVALLSRASDCRWIEDAKSLHEGAQFKVGQTLNIATGLAEIVFGCGATAIVQGPAVLELESNKSGALRLGKLTANVPDHVKGFTVHTPTVHLVSLCRQESKGVAKLTTAADCQWAEGNMAVQEGSRLLPGQEVKLADGLAEITFTSGAKVILQGPANLEITSSKSAILHGGRMTADVPDDLEGFIINTKLAEILSLPAEVGTPKEPPTGAVKQ